jgi:hypothetical protein
MRIEGEWYACQDGVTRPVVRAHVDDVAGLPVSDRFLIDTGADRTVLSADFWRRIGIPGDRPPAGVSLVGVGGGTGFVVLRTVLQFLTDDGRVAMVRGELAAFTDPDATDLSILGRDVLDSVRLIVSRPDNEVLLLAANHRYRVLQT